MRKIKVGQIGTGCQHAGQIMQCMLKFPEVFDIVGLVDTDGQGSHPDFDGVRRITEEELFSCDGLDAVIVEPEEHYLPSVAKRCIDRGCSIHMDKPGGEAFGEFRDIMKEAKRKGLVVQMGYMYRYNPAVQHCIDLVRSGGLGEILTIDTAMNTGHPDFMREWLGTFEGGSMYIFGCHMIDFILTMQGMPLRIIPFQKKTFLNGIDVYDNCYALLEYPKGVSTVRINSTEVNGFGRRQLVVCGSKGTMEIKPLENPLLASISTRDMVESPFRNYKQPLDFEVKGRYDDMMLDFAAMVGEKKENPYTYEYEVALHRAYLIACGVKLDLGEDIVL